MKKFISSVLLLLLGLLIVCPAQAQYVGEGPASWLKSKQENDTMTTNEIGSGANGNYSFGPIRHYAFIDENDIPQVGYMVVLNLPVGTPVPTEGSLGMHYPAPSFDVDKSLITQRGNTLTIDAEGAGIAFTLPATDPNASQPWQFRYDITFTDAQGSTHHLIGTEDLPAPGSRMAAN